jgi:hypothetical protein
MHVASTIRFRPLALTAVAIILSTSLSACGRNAEVAEQVMEAKQAAERAEAAQRKAEQALERIIRQTSPEVSVIEDDPENYAKDEEPARDEESYQAPNDGATNS